MPQHCTDGSFRLGRWRAHTEALSDDSGPEALSTHGPYVALQVFSAILPPIASELSAHCCRTRTMTRYSIYVFLYQLRQDATAAGLGPVSDLSAALGGPGARSRPALARRVWLGKGLTPSRAQGGAVHGHEPSTRTVRTVLGKIRRVAWPTSPWPRRGRMARRVKGLRRRQGASGRRQGGSGRRQG